jgi:hypothetical protein
MVSRHTMSLKASTAPLPNAQTKGVRAAALVAAQPLFLPFIHPSAWKVDSPKFAPSSGGCHHAYR